MENLDLTTFFTTFAVFAGIVPVATQFVLKYWKTEHDQLVSWGVSIVLAFLGWVFKIGIFDGAAWYWFLIYGFAAGLVANGIFDIPFINGLLSLIQKKKNS